MQIMDVLGIELSATLKKHNNFKAIQVYAMKLGFSDFDAAEFIKDEQDIFYT